MVTMQGKCFVCAKLIDNGKILNPTESSIILQEILGFPESKATNSIVQRFQKVCYCQVCLQRLLNIQIFINTQVPELEETLKKEQKLLWKDLVANCTTKNESNKLPLGMLQLLRNEVVEEIWKCGRKYLGLGEIFQNWTKSKSDHNESIFDEVNNNSELGSLQTNRETNDDYQKQCPGREDFNALMDDETHLNDKVVQMCPVFEVFVEEKFIRIVDLKSENDNSEFGQLTHDDKMLPRSGDSPSPDSAMCKSKNKKKKFTTTSINQRKRKYPSEDDQQMDVSDSSDESQSKTCECKGCGNAFSNKIALKTHILSVHRNGQLNGRCVCLECEYTGKDMFDLAKHRLRRHTQQKRDFRCDECEAAFKEEPNLVKHKKLHKRCGLYKCKFCSAKFSEIAHVQLHVRMGHPTVKINESEEYYTFGDEFSTVEEEVRKKQEEQIDKIRIKQAKLSTSSNNFTKSRSAPKSRNKKFESRYQYKKSEKRKFQCDECKACFERRYHLTRHKDIHRGEQSLECKSCLVKFRDSRTLAIHNRGGNCFGTKDNVKIEN